MKLTRLAATLFAVGWLSSASTANAAEIRLLIERMSGTTVTASLLARDQLASDDDLASVESVRVSDALLASVFPELEVGSFVTASTNRGTADDFRTLSLDSLFTVKATATNLLYTYRVTAAADNMIQPTADDKLGSSSHTARFTTARPDNQTRYQGWIDPNNTMAIALPGTLTTFGAITPGLHGPFSSTSALGIGTNSVSTDLGPVSFTDDNPYSMSAQLLTTVRRGGARVQSGGDLTVSAAPLAIPEPTTGLLFSAGLVLVAMARRRK